MELCSFCLFSFQNPFSVYVCLLLVKVAKPLPITPGSFGTGQGEDMLLHSASTLCQGKFPNVISACQPGLWNTPQTVQYTIQFWGSSRVSADMLILHPSF